MYAHRSLTKYLDDLSARTPAPGGGSACALVCACAASLMCMVARYSIGKKAHRAGEPFLKKVLRAAERSAAFFLKSVDDDCAAFQARDMRKALSVPRAVARRAAGLVVLCPELARQGNPALASDTAVAAVLLEAGLTSARWLVAINCQGKKDTRSLLARLAKDEKRGHAARVRTEKTVGDIIRR